MCPLQVELVYCLQASWQERGVPPKVSTSVYMSDGVFIKPDQTEVTNVSVAHQNIQAGTTLILLESVRNMVRRSIPMPHPAVGGRPYSSAVQKVSSMNMASSSPSALACENSENHYSTELQPIVSQQERQKEHHLYNVAHYFISAN